MKLWSPLLCFMQSLYADFCIRQIKTFLRTESVTEELRPWCVQSLPLFSVLNSSCLPFVRFDIFERMYQIDSFILSCSSEVHKHSNVLISAENAADIKKGWTSSRISFQDRNYTFLETRTTAWHFLWQILSFASHPLPSLPLIPTVCPRLHCF